MKNLRIFTFDELKEDMQDKATETIIRMLFQVVNLHQISLKTFRLCVHFFFIDVEK